ncbi:MAG: 6-phosphofructokinase [Anaerolineae bacterium UTCFX2]|jgi:6-phosphofructokinase 1|nr:6-phosphofructokinase [Anaerolineales bacterium]OQY89317.1 MAG: 6-phosphofructokinase [Anaerolineae bacterium UTCFX2]
MATVEVHKIGILTSGGDAQGMNAAIRSVTRTALDRGIKVYAIYEGYQGLVEGGQRIREMTWDSVGGILHRGGTFIGTARCDEFKKHEGRLRAAQNLIATGIHSLVVIGGDGSLAGANIFRQEWSSLLQELIDQRAISGAEADAHPYLDIVGLVGSIDNDMFGTDMTIGADSALHRITEAIDAISSTAASHQRTFVVKVMGRNCGYLALMGGLATGADWILIPENPPNVDNWQKLMVERLIAGRRAGRRDTIVVIAEGAHDRHGNYIGSTEVAKVLEEGLHEEVRVTVLGHVQRGGVPSAFDRNLGTLLGHAAVETLLDGQYAREPQLIGLRGNRIVHSPLMECVEKTHLVAKSIKLHDYDTAMSLRGNSFIEAFDTFKTMLRALPHPLQPDQKRYRLGIMHAGAPAPAMNAAVRAATRIGIDRGHIILGIRNGFPGLIEGNVQEMDWMSVNGWAPTGGCELGTTRQIPSGSDFYNLARAIEKFEIHGLIIIGGWAGYEMAFQMFNARENYPAFNIPTVCLPATINNNLPGSELSIGADTALNNIVGAVDKIKDSAVALRRVFVVEVMGRFCGYLALMSGLATGAERVYINEEGVTLKDLQTDVEGLRFGFTHGKRLGLIIRSENANPVYNTQFMCALFEEEGGELFDVRQAILGHMQQGGSPSPFDRIQSTRLATRCIDFMIENLDANEPASAFIGLQGKEIRFHNFEDFDRMVDMKKQRPKEQWWMGLRPIAKVLAQPTPDAESGETKSPKPVE